MKLTLDPNGWVVHVDQLDVLDVNSTERDQLRTLPYTNLLVVIHNTQPLTIDQYHQFTSGVFDDLNNDLPAKEKIFVEQTNKEIIRVTGKKDAHGEITGLFGMPDDLPWHCNEPGRTADERPDALCLYGVEHTDGSITGFTNSIQALKDLRQATDAPVGLLRSLDQLMCYYNYSGSTDNGPMAADVNYQGRTGFNKFVTQNKSGATGIHWSPMQNPIFYIGKTPVPNAGQQAWFSYLYKFLTQPKYQYAHHWQDYEIIINCQWLSMHARPAFENIENRLLWRAMGYVSPFDGSAIDTGQLELRQ